MRLALVTGLVGAAAWAGDAAAQQRVTLPATDVPLRDRPAPVWSVGAAEGDSWELLSGVRSAVFDAQDNLYALDTGNHRVLVFDREGRFVRAIGKQGGGPGEFQFPMSIAIAADGRLVVGEGRGLSVFRTDGTFERLVPSTAGLGGLRFDEFAGHPEGGVTMRTRRMPQPGEAPAAEGARMPAPIVRVSLEEGVPPDTILPLTEPMPTVRDLQGQGGRRMRMMITEPPPTFARTLRWAPLPDGRVAVAEETDAWELKLAANGTFTHVITRPIAPRAPSERDRQRAREQRRESLKSGGNGVRVTTSGAGGGATFATVGGGGEMPEEEIRRQIEEMKFAERIPVVQDLFADVTGRIWVERAPAAWGEPAPVDLVGSDGRYIGTVTDVELPLATSRSGLALWVEKDELEVERIVVKRLPASWK